MSDPSTQVGLSLSFISDAEISARNNPPSVFNQIINH